MQKLPSRAGKFQSALAVIKPFMRQLLIASSCLKDQPLIPLLPFVPPGPMKQSIPVAINHGLIAIRKESLVPKAMQERS